ncbi:MAG TPA: AMP-binding protein [Longimicrobiaceae bacterium]
MLPDPDPTTAGRPLLAWLDDPAADRGIHFARADGTWSFHAYARLAELARRAAGALACEGVRRDDVVTLMGRSGPEFVAAFFGTLLAGATPSPVAPPLTFGDPDAYRDHLAGVLRTARPALVVADAELADEVAGLAGGAWRTLDAASLLAGDAAADPPGRGVAELALLQLTSGSSGPARAVRVPYAALEANVGAIRHWLRWTRDDAFASWLPLHHDMGLVGGLLSSVVAGSDLWLLQPEHFVREPLRWLRGLGASGARLTVTPAFGLDHAARRVPAEALEGLDFSGVRGVVVGAERIDARTLDAFQALLAPAGLRREALLPAYGLAEATLAVSGVPVDEGWTGVAVEPASLALGRAVEPAADGGATVVGCGRPLAGVDVRIEDEDRSPLPEGHVGEVVVRGASLAAGYGGEAASLTTLADGVLRTGDAGFLLDGQLFVLGRLGDSVKVRGRVVFSEDLEVALGEAGASRPRVAVLLGVHAGVPTAVLLAEEAEPAWRGAAEALLRRRTGGARVVFVGAARGTIARTSSGKPRRRRLWQAFVEGSLAGEAGAAHTGSENG